MAINKKLIHFKLKSTFESELEAGNILDTSIVFIQDANLIWTHGTYYCLPKDEILISEGTEPTDGQEIWIDLSEDPTVFAVEEAPKDGKQYVRENGKWVEIPITDLSNYLAKDNTEEYTPTSNYNPATKKYVDDNKGVEEAPNDGKAYIRKNESWVEHQEQEVYVGTTEPSIDCDIWINPEDGTMKYKKEDGSWEEIAGGGGIGEITETVKVNLTSNRPNPNSDLIGVEITVEYSGLTKKANWEGSELTFNIPHSTEYTIKAAAVEGYSTPATQSYTADRVNRDITLNYVYAPAIGTIFKDSDGANTLEQNGGTDTSWIKGKRCLVKKTSSGVAICYLDENNSELFHDGTTAASLDGSMGQWMTDVPEYYFNVDESTSGVHALQVSQFQQDGWKQSRRVLVGVTEAVNVSNKLWSKKGGQSTGSLTSVVFHNYATALGSGFDIIDYETHCKIAHLFYAKYANRNPQEMSQFGYGENSYTRTIGTTSSLGNNDGKTSTQISFLGIEDFYGGKYEWMSGIHSNGSIYYIYDGFEPDAVPTASYRTVDVGGSARSGYISKVYWGEHGDMIPTEVSASSTTHYCDWGYVAGSGWRAARRSSSSAYDNGGVACFLAAGGAGGSGAGVGSRIQYRGSIQVIEDPAEFKSLPVGF